jgi:hypothetical protein
MNMENLIGVSGGSDAILGKFLYFSLSDVLIEKTEMQGICDALGFPYTTSGRTSATDAFRSATGDIYERVVTDAGIFKVYCRDNKRMEKGQISRELVKETLDERTNRYTKLANINFLKEGEWFEAQNIDYDPDVNVWKYCDEALRLFDLYKRCLSRGQIEGLVERYVYSMSALKISVNGKLFFAPKSSMHMVDLLEDFIAALNAHNLHDREVTINSMYIVDVRPDRALCEVA